MKRTALLIGNSNGLAGVKIDINNFNNFLKSDIGGKWYDSEITVEMNPTRRSLLAKIEQLKTENNDFAIVVFSGHGAYTKNTILELNRNEEIISEIDLKYISKRQISIFDCCRNVVQEPLKNKALLSDSFNRSERNDYIRNKYDARIMQSIEQQISLYACSIGESALDTENGGLYSSLLLKSVSPDYDSLYKLVGEAHEQASEKTKNAAWVMELHRQNPSATIPKCLSSQQLIMSINPNY